MDSAKLKNLVKGRADARSFGIVENETHIPAPLIVLIECHQPELHCLRAYLETLGKRIQLINIFQPER